LFKYLSACSSGSAKLDVVATKKHLDTLYLSI
jgi:hypothetical protein